MAEPFLRVDKTDEGLTAHNQVVHWGLRQNFVVTILPWLLVLPAFTAICFSFYWDPFAVYMVIMFTLFVAIFITVMDFVAGRKMLLYSGLIGICGIGLACFVGGILYQGWLKQYYHLTYSRFYQNVLATEYAAAHSDAGRLDFAVGAAADVSKSVGYQAGGHIYCVAPILSADAVRAEFWAVGVDCCGLRAAFSCDDAIIVSGELKTGLVMLDYEGPWSWFGQSTFDCYRRAITQAKACFALVGPDMPTLVRWVNRDSASSVINWYMFEPLLFYLLYLIVYLFITASCALTIQRSFRRVDLLNAATRKAAVHRQEEDYGATSDDY